MVLDKRQAVERVERIIDSYRVYSGHGYIVPAKKFDEMVKELKEHFVAGMKAAEDDVLDELTELSSYTDHMAVSDTIEIYKNKHVGEEL